MVPVHAADLVELSHTHRVQLLNMFTFDWLWKPTAYRM